MARSNKPTDCLKPSPADEIFQRIRAWHQAENPSPEELIEWLTDVSEKLTLTINYLDSNKEQIRNLDELTRLKASSTVLNALDFLDRSDVAGELLSGVVGGRVRDAFVEGLRIGLLYEKMMSLIDGRYYDHWDNQDRRQRGARAINEAHVELHPLYQHKVDIIMSTTGKSYSAACEEIAAELGVSDRTVRKHTTNPAPRNQGRHGRKPL